MLLTTTPRILDAISSLSHSDRPSLNALPSTAGAPIEHKTVIALSRFAKDVHLSDLLRGTSVYVLPPTPKPQPSREYVALMAHLRKEQEQYEYHSLVSQHTVTREDPAEEKDDISPSLVMNILLSVVMCAAAMFHMTRYWHNDGIRVIVSLLVGIIVGVAEVTVFAAYLRKVKVSREKERALREKKQFIGEYQGPEADNVEVVKDNFMVEKEEIWGRGINGGVRRRVREKWEQEQSSPDNE